MVYNESSGLFDAVSGWTHKLLSPSTYRCALCKVTFGLTGMLVPWKSYIELLPFPVTFLHRDEFREQFPSHVLVPLPLILAEISGRTEILLSAADINATGSLSGLIGRMQSSLEKLR